MPRGIVKTFNSLLGIPQSSKEPKKVINQQISEPVKNGLSPLSQEYFRRGNQIAAQNLLREKTRDNEDLFRGYLFSALELRKNSFADFAENNIITDSENPNIENPYHPYLKLIEESTLTTEYQFWLDLMTDLDMKGECFIFLLRRVVYNKDSNGKQYVEHIGFPTGIEALDATRVVKLRDGLGRIVGYEEWIDSTHKRTFVPEQVVHIWNKNPFHKDQPYSIFDAAKDFQYTLNKGTNFTQAALANNSNTPGILSTDQVLNDAEYDNLISRINGHEAGKVIVTDGAGKLNFTAISQDLNGTALDGITDVSRQTIFAITGTSKTMLGIEESGTTRETSRVQYSKFIQRTISPVAKRICSALNFDYRTKYPEKYNSEKMFLVIRNDGDSQSALEKYTAQKQFYDSVMEITYSGYTLKSAEDFMNGEIAISDLEIDSTLLQETEKPDEEDTQGSSNPKTSTKTSTETPTGNSNIFSLSELSRLAGESETKFFEQCEHNHHHEQSLEEWIDNALLKEYIVENKQTKYGAELSSKLKGIYRRLLNNIRKSDLEILKKTKAFNAISPSDLRTLKQEQEAIEKTTELIKASMKQILSSVSGERKYRDRKEWDLKGNVNLLGEKDVITTLNYVAQKAAESHVKTLYKDLSSSLNNLVENDLSELSEVSQKDKDIALFKLYNKISNQRAEVFAENAFMHAVGMGNFFTDALLVKINGVERLAYKQLTTTYLDPCEECQYWLHEGPIPLWQSYGETREDDLDLSKGIEKLVEGGDFPLLWGVFHPNCRCVYELFIDDPDKKKKPVAKDAVSEDPASIIDGVK